MITTECYITFDGMLFENEDAAKRHEDDAIGQELDELIHRVLKLDPLHRSLYNGVLAALHDRTKLKASVDRLHKILNHEEN